METLLHIDICKRTYTRLRMGVQELHKAQPLHTYTQGGANLSLPATSAFASKGKNRIMEAVEHAKIPVSSVEGPKKFKNLAVAL